MNLKFTASVLAEGNHLFQASISILDDGIKVRVPNFWSDSETYFKFHDISGFTLETPSWYSVLKYSTIRFNAKGVWVEAHGFTTQDAKRIKHLIEEGQKKIPSSTATFQSDYVNSQERKEKQYAAHRNWVDSVYEQRKSNREKIVKKADLLKSNLTNAIYNLYFDTHYKNGQLAIAQCQEKIHKCKERLQDFLVEIEMEHLYESMINGCRKSAQKLWEENRIEEEQQQEKKNQKKRSTQNPLSQFSFDPAPLTVLNVNKLVELYDELDVDILEDFVHIENHKSLVQKFVHFIFQKNELSEIRNDLDETSRIGHDDAFTKELRKLLILIEHIFTSRLTEVDNNLIEISWNYALNNNKIHEFLKSKENSLESRMSKIIDVTDNLIDRMDKWSKSQNA